jgi:hypothetical protein
MSSENVDTKNHILFPKHFTGKCAAYKIIWKNMVDTDRPQMTLNYGTCPLHAGKLRLQVSTQNM